MSNMKNGFSTLNRWLGKKNKTDKVTPNGKLSKSSTNLSSLSVSSTNINETSQLEYNRITPLPVATSNAPFEQTFRITVLLPKDQLYVARLGARVPLSKLLELVCENKLLDSTKYEFRNPVDPSQVYNCDLTIGAVGLSEIRLCHKSESYDSFNADEIIKLHRTAIIRDSLSSSEFSSRYSKHTTKTTSPYSSSNSLNSMDSTGMNCVRTPVSPPATLTTSTTPLQISAPPRKKRAAPRPPSQIAIPEKTALENGIDGSEAIVAKTTKSNDVTDKAHTNDSQPLNNRYVSTPNLSTATTAGTNGYLGSPTVEKEPDQILNGYSHDDVEQEKSQVQQKNARNLYGGSVQNLSSPRIQQQSTEFPEPSPRKRMIQVKKKSTAPAPPSRGSMYADSDTMSIRSMTPSTPDTPLTPLTPYSPSDGITAEPQLVSEHSPISSKKQDSAMNQINDTEAANTRLQSSTPVLEASSTKPAQVSPEAAQNMPKPLPRVTTANTLLNASNVSNENTESPSANVSKTMLNRTPTPEPRSLSAEPSDSDSYLSSHIAALKNTATMENDDEMSPKQEDTVSYLDAHITALKNHESTLEHDDDALSKQADSGIGEPVPSPIPDSLPSEGSAHEGKSAFESSSDDDDIVKVYNFKLGKTVVKSPTEPQTLEDFSLLTATAQTDSEDNTPAPITQEATPNFSDSASWNFSIPISPPPNFADGRFAKGFETDKTSSDMPITPKIKERPVLNFESISNTEKSNNQTVESGAGDATESQANKVYSDHLDPLQSPTTPLNEIVDELSAIINEKRLDTLIKKADDPPEIEAAKPNTLSNFSITTIAHQTQEKQTEMPNSTMIDNTDCTKKETINDKSIETVENHSSQPTESVTMPQSSEESPLTHLPNENIEHNELSPIRRRSSGELSIGESPSLQSPEVIKTILNSRKNSLTNNSDVESKTTEGKKTIGNAKVNSVEETPKSLNSAEKVEESKKSITELNVSLATEPTKSKELPKVYRYSGPPSINFSTWNERPKAQVSIKNEGDYIFGGKNADSQSAAVTTAAMEINTNSYARNNRISMPASSFWFERENAPPPPVSPKPTKNTSTTERMGIYDKDYRVPITVKPLRDVTIENDTTNTTSSTHQEPSKNSIFRKSTSITKVLLNGECETKGKNNKFETIQKRSFTGATHTSTLPRSNTNRFSMPAGNMVGPSLLRSTSITQLEANKPKQYQSETVTAPFGQNTLRKTGLKEKILAKEAEAQHEPKGEDETGNDVHTQNSSLKHFNNKYTTTTTISNGFANTAIKPDYRNEIKLNSKSVKPIHSAKLELNLQNSTSVYLNEQTSTNSAVASAATNTTISKMQPMTTPTPPPAPNGFPLNTPNGSAATTPSSPEARDQLLLAIRNFRREDLNRV